MAKNSALERIKGKAYGYSSNKTPAIERIKSRTTGVGGYSYYSLNQAQKDYKNAYKTVSDYASRINGGEWLSQDDLAAYKSAIDSYTKTSTMLRNASKASGQKYTDDEDKAWETALSSLASDYTTMSDIFSKYKNNDAYQAAKKAQADREEMLKYDLGRAETELTGLNNMANIKSSIANLENRIAVLKQVKSDPYGNYAKELKEKQQELESEKAKWAHVMEYYGSEEALKAVLSEKTAYYNNAKRLQEGVKLGGVSNPESEVYDPNFSSLSSLGSNISWNNTGSSSIKNTLTVYDDLKAATLAMNEKLQGKELFNESLMTSDKSGLAGYWESLTKGSEYNTENESLVNIYREMNDLEAKTLAYYLEKDRQKGTNQASEYVNSLKETLNARLGEKIASAKNTDTLKYLFAIEAGLDQYIQGRDALFSGEDYIPTSATQFASGYVRESLDETGIPAWYNFNDKKWENKAFGSSTGQLFYDALNTSANMLPSTLASAAVNFVAPGAGSTVGLGLLGASAAGNAKAEMLRLGYTKEQANTYGILAGASEIALEKLLGGIPGLSDGDGIFSSLATKIFGKVDNAIARGAIALGSNALDEGLEEGLQTVIEPWLKEVVTNVDWDSPTVDEVLYSSLLGALSSVGFTAGSMTANNVSANAEAKNTYGGQQTELVNQAVNSDFSNVSSLGAKLQKKLDNGKNLSGGDINRLLEISDRATIQSAVSERLTELGEEGNVTRLASALTKQIMGEELSTSEQAAISKSKNGYLVLTEADPENIRGGGLANKWAESIGTKRLNADVYNRQTKAETANATPENARATGAKIPALSERVSPTIVTKNAEGKTVKSEINGIEVDGGKATFTLANGERVSADKATFQTDTQRLVADMAVEKVSRVEGFSTEAATAMVKGYTDNLTPGEYNKVFTEAFNAGKEGLNTAVLRKMAANNNVSEATLFAAYDIGREFTKNSTSVLKTGAESGIINTVNAEATNEGRQGLSLRGSVQRSNSQNTQGQLSQLESGAGQVEGRGKAFSRPAEAEAARLVNEGRKVSVADLGIPGGTTTQMIYRLEDVEDTPSMKKAREKAEARGLTVRYFAGDNLHLEDGQGGIDDVRGFIKGKYVYVRADHSTYTADQIMEHELGHDKISKGEVDVQKVRNRLKNILGDGDIEAIAEHYMEAYSSTPLTADEIWEEMICDSLGDMNIFSKSEKRAEAAEVMKHALPAIQQAVAETKTEATNPDAKTVGKASRDFGGKVAKYLSDSKVGKANREYLYHQLLKLYSGISDGIADGIAIANGKTVFIVDSGRDNGKLDFGVRRMRNISADIGREQFIRRANDTARSKGDISDELLERLGYGNSGDSGLNLRREFGSELQADTGKSPNQQSGVSEENADQRGLTKGKASRELDVDSEGNELSPAVARRFANSKVVDENGRLKVVYHGTVSGEFDIFDKSKGSVEGDFGSGFYFTDKETDVEKNYEFGGPDFDNKVWRRAEQIWDEDPDIDMVDAREQAKKELYKESHRFEVYLNIENPAIVGETILFANDSYLSEYNEEDYDNYDDYIGDVDQLVTDDIDNIIWDIERNVDLYSNTDSIRNALYEAYYEGGVSIEKLKEKINELYLESNNGDIVSNEVTRQIIESLGYDGIIDPTVATKFKNMGMEADTTHYIVFKPNQIKDVGNKNPTDNPNIHYSRELDLDDYSQISNMRVEANKVREDIKKIEKSEDFKAQMDKLTQTVDSGDAEGGIAAYNEWKKSSGYGELIAKRDQLEADIAKYSKAYEDNRVNRALNEEAEAIKKSGLSEADYFRKEAEKVFGYTPYFYDAGYIVPNGKMLNFSGEKGKHFGSRGEDHRAIGQIYANTQGGKALTRFMNDGNIRIMAESPGVDISSTVEPTKEQYATIKNFLYDYAKEEYFNIDLSDENGRVVGSLEYEGKINPARVINDIKHYYETGEIRSQSQVDKFRYSRELDLDYDESIEATKTVTNRELLANALESAAQSDAEYTALQDYKKNIKELNKKTYHLSKLKEEIKKLSFGKGQKDAKRLAELKEKAAKLERSINYYDRQLVRLEAMKPIKDLVQRERSKAYKAAAEKGREALHRNVEGRHKSEARAKIKKLKQKFQSIIEHPTDRQYIPVDLMSAMIDVCDLIDTSTSLYKADGSINKAQQARNEQAQRLLKLKAEYDKLAKSADYAIAYEYEQEIADYIQTIMTDYANKNIADMTLAELTDLYQTMRSIEETLRDARRLIGWSDAMTVYEAGDSIIEEQTKIGEKRKQNGISKVDDSIVNLSLSPVRAVLRMAGYNEDSALYHSIREIENGTREQKKFVMDAVKKFESLTTGKNASTYEKAIYDPYGKELIDKNGNKFHVTKMQMMQAIMSYEREMANDKLHHVSNGGFTFADIKLLGKGEVREAVSAKYAHTITLGSDVAVKFMSELANDKWAQEYMAEARNFFDVTAKEAINEANMKLKHRIVATGKNYIPYEVNSDFIVREINSENDIQQVISGYGMLKDLKEGASQPLIITGLNNVLDRHIEQVGNVAALAVPIRNFNKIWNVKSTDGSTTVREKIKSNWGVGGEDLITQAIKDVQGARRQDKSPIYKLYKKVKGNIIQGTFLGNVSVVFKQIGSMFTSTSMLNYRDPVSMMANLIATKANRDAIAAEVNKYTAVAWVRGQGLSDAELYELKTTAKRSTLGRAIDKLPPALNAAKWITQMDYDVALSLWKYAKEDTAKRTGLKGEELLKATADYYNDVIENTQSMSDALHRPEVQKSDNIASETLGIFKTDLYQNAGLLRVAFESRMAKPSKETNRALVKAVGGTLASMCWASLITSVMAAFRYKVDRYRDEEDDEITLENWLKVAGGDMLEEMVGYMFPLFGSEAAGLLKAWVTGETYEFDNLSLEALNDFSKAMTSLGKLFAEGEDDPEKRLRVIKNVLVKGTSIFGVPANNVTRFFDAVRLHAKDIANGEFLSFEAGLTSPNNTRLYRAYIEGDADKINKASRLYKDEAALKAGLRKGLRENDPRLREAAIAKLNGDNDTYKRLCNEVLAEGKFDRTIIIDAFAAEYNYQKNKADEEGK